MKQKQIKTRGGLSFNTQRGCFSITAGGLTLKDYTVAIASGESTIRGTDIRWHSSVSGETQTITGTGKGVTVTLTISSFKDNESHRIVIGGEIRFTKAMSCERIDILHPVSSGTVSVLSMLTHGHVMGGCNLFTFPGTKAQKKPFESWHFAAFKTANDFSLASFDLKETYPCIFTGMRTMKNVQAFTASMRTEADVKKGDIIRLQPLTITSGSNGHAMLERYGERQSSSKKDFSKRPIMWNSWDYYRWCISEAEVMENVEFIANDPVLSKHVEYIVVDDGWQYAYGDWEVNYKFPSGMDGLARKIQAKGMKAGLWFAPFIVEEHSTIADWHPDMLVTGDKRLPGLAFSCMKRMGFILDAASRNGGKFLADIFARYRSMGYDYFKLDFLRYLQNGVYYNNGERPAKGKLMRDALQNIRNAAGNDAHILGCNFPFEAGDGIVDSTRVSSDVAPRWENVKINVKSMAARYWMNRVLWWSDPDFAVCRGDDTSDDTDLRRMNPLNVFLDMKNQNTGMKERWDNFVTYDEARVLMSLAVVNGGVIALSDKLTRLNERGLDLVRKTVAADDRGRGVPIDLFEHEYPERWVQMNDKGRRYLFVNYADNAKRLTIKSTDIDTTLQYRDFWTGEPVMLTKDSFTVTISKHSCLFLESI
ncbi:MAG: alpha-galactosidase [Spirochaetes bacterium]|nr:alpha-galactosidase [Spirochaetota bacterium]